MTDLSDLTTGEADAWRAGWRAAWEMMDAEVDGHWVYDGGVRGQRAINGREMRLKILLAIRAMQPPEPGRKA
jgi:hypothetical protein